jgi:5-methylcytosine-specific restriction endonuclease McrA
MTTHREKTRPILASKEVVLAESLSLSAKGLMCILHNEQDKADVISKELADRFPMNTIGDINSAIEELIQFGYLEVQSTSNEKYADWDPSALLKHLSAYEVKSYCGIPLLVDKDGDPANASIIDALSRLLNSHKSLSERDFLLFKEEQDSKLEPHYRVHTKEVFTRDLFRCVYCHSSEKLTLDHIIPKSRGGGHSVENLVTCCASCNSKKGARTPQEWLGGGHE